MLPGCSAWVVTNTSTCLTTGSITINNYSKLNLPIVNSENPNHYLFSVSSCIWTETNMSAQLAVWFRCSISSRLHRSHRHQSHFNQYHFESGSHTPSPQRTGATIGMIQRAVHRRPLAAFPAKRHCYGYRRPWQVRYFNTQCKMISSGFNTYSDSTRIIRGTLTINTGSNLGTGQY